jgi:small conductance mechanosensitive channel
LTFGIAYGDDVEDFKRAMNDFIAADILKDPAPFMGLSNWQIAPLILPRVW